MVVLDYGARTWTILPDASAPPAVSGLVAATPVPIPDANEFTVGSFNLERFYDTVNDPTTSDVVQEGKFTTYVNPTTGADDLSTTAPPWF